MWLSSDWKRSFTLGILSSPKKKVFSKRKSAAPETATDEIFSFFLSDSVAPYIYHLAGMTAIALCMMHVNVATRFLSSSPALYWGAATILLRAKMPSKHQSYFSLIYSHWIWLWAMVFALLGCLLFPNFFPWT